MLIRIHANYELNERLIIHARVENIADQEYELANFATPVKGAGLGFFTGITATF